MHYHINNHLAILLWKLSPDFNMKIILFGSCDIVYTGTTYTLKRRSIPSIYFRESNENGGHFFMLLYTSKYIHRNDWVELPKDNDRI